MSDLGLFMRRLPASATVKTGTHGRKRHPACWFCRHAAHGCRLKIVLDFEDRIKLFETIVLGRRIFACGSI